MQRFVARVLNISVTISCSVKLQMKVLQNLKLCIIFSFSLLSDPSFDICKNSIGSRRISQYVTGTFLYSLG